MLVIIYAYCSPQNQIKTGYQKKSWYPVLFMICCMVEEHYKTHSSCSARLWEYYTGVRRSYDAEWAAVWWKCFFGSPWADHECRYAYRYIQISALPECPWKTPSTYLPWNLKICSWFSEKFTDCSWRFSLLHNFNSSFLYDMRTECDPRSDFRSIGGCFFVAGMV